jgi:Bacillus/Clostridium GerA spore germination protein.
MDETNKVDKPYLSSNIEKNISEFKKLCRDCDDIIMTRMELGEQGQIPCFIAYVEVAVSTVMVEGTVLARLLNQIWNLPKEEFYQHIEKNGFGVSDARILDTMEDGINALMAGNAILFMEGYDKIIKISAKGYPNRGVPKAEVEKVLRGSQEGFSDAVKVNTALIRKRIRDAKLKVKEQQIGVRSRTTLALLYMDDLVEPALLNEIRERLNSFKVDGVLDIGILEQLTEKSWYSPFPQFQYTERPDKAAMAILEGKVVMLSDNSPSALILPTSYNNFFQTSDDFYNRFQMVTFIRILRYIAAIFAMFLPGAYLAVTNFHTQVLPTNLVLSFAAAREGVPFPSVIEILLLELAFELIREAGLRMPGPIGGTIALVGGLIVGQAAVTANLVSPIIVVLIAITALSSFSIPNDEFSAAFRLIKFIMVLVCASLGMYGLVLGIFVVVTHLAKLKSFGYPYLAPFVAGEVNDYQDKRDAIIRYPAFMLKKRPIYTKENARTRLKMERGKRR